MRFITVIVFMVFSGVLGAQNFADKEYYLVDELELDKMGTQDRQLVDSCLVLFHAAEHDSDRIEAIELITESCWDDNVWPKYNDWVLQVVEEKMKENISEMERKDLQRSLSGALNNKGIVYDNNGDIENALIYYHKSLAIDEELGDMEGIANSLNNIGFVYEHQGDYEQALRFYKKSMEVDRELGNTLGVASSLNNLGIISHRMGDRKKALEYYFESLTIKKEIADKKGVANAYNNIGSVYYEQDSLLSALKYFNQSLEIKEELGDEIGAAITLNNIGSIELESGNVEQAELSARKGLEIGQRLGVPRITVLHARLLSRVNKQTGKYAEALEMYELHIQMRDSIKNQETQKAAIRQQTKYEFEKAQLVKEQEEKELARIKEEQTQRRNNLQYSLIFLGILLFFGLILGLGFVKVSSTVAEGLIFFAFLILFEFLLVLGDPLVESITGGEPIYKLLANALLAGAIFPAHAFFERSLKKRLLK